MAVKVVIDSFPSSISSDDFGISVTISGAKSGTNYLRVELYKDGTTKYFGETFNGNGWYGGSDGLKYFPVEINAASISATFKARVGNPSQNDFTGAGEYQLKVKRYTASGSSASSDEESAVALQINYNIETPTPIPIPIPIPTSTPTVISTPIATATLQPIYIKKTTPSPVPTVRILAESIEASPSPETKTAGFPYLTLIFIFGGIFVIAIACWPIAREKFKAYNVRNAQKNN